MIRAQRTVFPGCCGLEITYYLARSEAPYNPELAQVAVTNTEQNYLRNDMMEAGFREVGTFEGNYNNTLTLWLRDRRKPTPRVLRPDSGLVSRRTGRPVTAGWALRNPNKVMRRA